MRDGNTSGLSLPLDGELQEGFQHILFLWAPPPPSRAPPEASINVCSADVSWNAGVPGQSPVLLDHPAWHCRKLGLLVLSRNSWPGR